MMQIEPWGAPRAPQFPYQMKDLCDRSGLPRQVVHFYIQEGLVPEGKKSGRNMAHYGEVHLQRLLTIKKLQREHFLPLKAIRALLDQKEDDAPYTCEQRARLREIKLALEPAGDGSSDATDRAWAELEAAGFSSDLGFGRGDLAIYVQAVDALFEAERAFVGERLKHLAPSDVGARLRQGLPVIGRLLARLHEERIMRYLEEREMSDAEEAP